MNKRRIPFATAIILLTISSYCVAQNTFPFPSIGNVGIGTTNPQHLLDLGTQNGKKLAVFQNSAGDDFYGFGIKTALLEFYAGAATGDLPGMVLRKISGNVGIGTSSPQAKLDVNGDLRVTNSGDGAVLLNLNSERSWEFQQLGTGAGTALNLKSVGGRGNRSRGNKNFVIETDGNVGIGTTNPRHLLDLGTRNGKKLAVFQNSAGDDFYGFGIKTALLEFYAGAATGDLPGMVLRKISGNVGIGRSDPQTRLHVKGTTTTSVLAITGGSDLSEQFAVNESQDSDLQTSRQPIKPGMVVCIDKENPGELIVNSTAYDRTVAGIISGAGGVESGILIGQDGSIANGDTPVALTGRVYCWADASYGLIAPGDLLTTSNTIGHAMKVTDYPKAQGAVIGKSMTYLATGRGLVLVLVTLH